jgi:uncharacterized LabA/DUF88 family protein
MNVPLTVLQASWHQYTRKPIGTIALGGSAGGLISSIYASASGGGNIGVIMFDQREKIALFIDGANLYATSKALGFDIDYKKMLKYFNREAYLLRAYYYTALIEDQEYSSIRPLIDWLDYNGYRVVTKPTKEFTDSMGRRKVKGNMDIELAIDALDLVGTVDHYVLFSGDGDFRSLVESLQRKGRKVSVISTVSTQPPMIADDLRRQADHFVDLVTLRKDIGRDPADRPDRHPAPAPVNDDDFEDDDY